MKGIKMKNKKGAASFYVVAFATLILVIIAVSFTVVILSEMARTANDDLSQSAYDSALAGIEDAKLAYYNYQKCLGMDKTEKIVVNDGVVECGEIIYWMNHPDEVGCDMVGRMLGRIKEDEKKEVIIEEVTTGSGKKNNMQQAYTCVQINTRLSDYRSTLTESDTTRVVRVRLGKDKNNNQINARDISKVKISWFAEEDRRSTGKFQPRYSSVDDGKIVFPSLRNGDTEMAVPPVISVGLVQTSYNFTLNDFSSTNGGTDRATLYLVPTGKEKALAERSKTTVYESESDMVGNYISVYDSVSKVNNITSDLVVKSNDRTVKNLPLAVYCDTANSEFACSTTMELPNPVGGGSRSNDTFLMVVSLPYGQPNTSFSLEFYCRDDLVCGQEVLSGGGTSSEKKPATVDGMQIEIDSTGRANNLYRRVEARLDSSEAYFPYPLYGIELLGDDDDSLLKKPGRVECEWTEEFGGATCSE